MIGRNRFVAILTTCLLGSGLSLPTAAETLYRWVDERGDPVHSDRPPPKGVEYEVISTSSSYKRVVSAEEGAVPLETSPRVGNDFVRVNTEEAERRKKNPEYCKQARQNLETLSSSEQVKMRNDQGEIRVLTAEQMAQQRARAQSQIDLYCE